jgi:hypothetical protein
MAAAGRRQIFGSVARWRVACLQVLDKRFPVCRGANRHAANDRTIACVEGIMAAIMVGRAAAHCAELTYALMGKPPWSLRWLRLTFGFSSQELQQGNEYYRRDENYQDDNCNKRVTIGPVVPVGNHNTYANRWDTKTHPYCCDCVAKPDRMPIFHRG